LQGKAEATRKIKETRRTSTGKSRRVKVEWCGKREKNVARQRGKMSNNQSVKFGEREPVLGTSTQCEPVIPVRTGLQVRRKLGIRIMNIFQGEGMGQGGASGGPTFGEVMATMSDLPPGNWQDWEEGKLTVLRVW